MTLDQFPKNVGAKAHEQKEAQEILEFLAGSTEPVRLARLATVSGLSRIKTSRILRSLCAEGVVERVKGEYRLVFCLESYRQRLAHDRNMIEYAHPVLEQLAGRLNEAIYLTVPTEDEVLFLDMVDCRQKVKTASFLGRLLPFFSNAAGKVIRSLDSMDLVARLLRKLGRRKGRLELEKLEIELEDIRMKGVAVDRCGLGEGVIAVAVAVRDYTGGVIAAIVLIGPSVRIVSERIEKEIIPALKEGAELLSGRFGYCQAF